MVKSLFFDVFAYIWVYGGLLEASWNHLGSVYVRKKNAKHQINQSFWGSYFGLFFEPNRFFLHFFCVASDACFRHRFWDASTVIFDDLGVISGCMLGTFCTFFC